MKAKNIAAQNKKTILCNVKYIPNLCLTKEPTTFDQLRKCVLFTNQSIFKYNDGKI